MSLQGSRLGRPKTGRKRLWPASARHTAAGLLLLLATLSLGGGAAASGCTPGTGIWCQDPFAFTDPYTSLAWVDTSATTAAVDTSGSGTVTLPAGPGVLALGPACSVG